MGFVRQIKKPDTTNESPEYWEKVLTSHGLSMERGTGPRITVTIEHEEDGTPITRRERALKYVGGSQNIIGVTEELHRERSGRVRPKGRRAGQLDVWARPTRIAMTGNQQIRPNFLD